MAGMGLGWSNANSEMAGQIRQRIADQIMAEERARAAAQQQFMNQRMLASDERQNRQLDQNEQLRKDTLAETARGHDLTAANQFEDNNRALNDQIPAGTFFEDAPAQRQIVGRLQSVGGATMEPNQQERPAVETGPLLPGDTGEAKKRGFLKLASEKQNVDAATRADKANAAQHQADELTRQQARDTETTRHNKAMEGRPQPNATVTIQTVDNEGNPITKVVPKSEAIGKDYKKGPSAVTANRLDSARAVQQTGEDIIRQLSDPAFIAAVGPVMGRASKLADFVGNPPPEFSGLAGQIESYALANMGVHGMRSAQGAAMISKLLDQHHTPESLIAAVKGLNGFSQHFLENAGRGGPSGGGTVRMTAPDGRSLQVPADKVAELERAGAKRVP